MQRGWGLGGSAARWSLQRPGGLLRSVLPSSMCQGHFSLGSREVMSSKEEMFSSCSLFLLSEKSFLRRFPTTIPQEIFSGLSLIRIKSEPIMDKKMRPLWCLKPVLMPSLGGRERQGTPSLNIWKGEHLNRTGALLARSQGNEGGLWGVYLTVSPYQVLE